MYLFDGTENLPMTLMLSLMLANEQKHVEYNKKNVCVCVCVCEVYLVIYIFSHFITV
jgi:hypothetical protein